MFTYFEWMPDYIHLRNAVAFLGSVFTRIWGVICTPFILENKWSSAGGNYYPYYSYIIPILAFGFVFIIIIFLKKLISALLGGV